MSKNKFKRNVSMAKKVHKDFIQNFQLPPMGILATKKYNEILREYINDKNFTIRNENAKD